MSVDEELHGSQGAAVLLMLLSILIYSMYPVLITVLFPKGEIITAAGMWAAVFGAGGAIMAGVLGFRIDSSATVRKILTVAPWWMYAVAAVGALQWALLARSIHDAEPAVSAVLFETWPTLVLVGRWMFRSPSMSKRAGFSEAGFVGCGRAGAVMVVLSGQHGDSAGLGAVLALIGSLVVAAGVLASVNGGEIIASRLMAERHAQPGVGLLGIRTIASMLPRAITWMASGAVMLWTAAVLGGVPSGQALGAGAVCGALHVLSTLMFTSSIHMNRKDAIIGMNYIIPALSVVWLWAFKGVDLVQPAVFALGVAVVVASNTGAGFITRNKAAPRRIR